jgi:hypothetical protein
MSSTRSPGCTGSWRNARNSSSVSSSGAYTPGTFASIIRTGYPYGA